MRLKRDNQHVQNIVLVNTNTSLREQSEKQKKNLLEQTWQQLLREINVYEDHTVLSSDLFVLYDLLVYFMNDLFIYVLYSHEEVGRLFVSYPTHM